MNAATVIHGVFRGGTRTLDPSTRALGPNRYLGQRTFLIMMMLALGVHLALIIVFSLIKPPLVTDIPVRALSFKIGDNVSVAPMPMQAVAPVATPIAAPVAAPALQAATTEWKATPKPKLPPQVQPKVEAEPVKQPKIIPIAPMSERQTPEENRAALPSLPGSKTVVITDTPSAIAQTPQRFIREVGAAPQIVPASTPSSVQGAEEGAVQAIRARYEEQISAWIQMHKLYPMAAQGAEGRVVIRMRIDRTGYVRYYAIEESSGSKVLDAAAIDMVRRANPVPAVPVNYPAGTLIEFLVPITFKVPR